MIDLIMEVILINKYFKYKYNEYAQTIYISNIKYE